MTRQRIKMDRTWLDLNLSMRGSLCFGGLALVLVFLPLARLEMFKGRVFSTCIIITVCVIAVTSLPFSLLVCQIKMTRAIWCNQALNHLTCVQNIGAS